MCASDASQGSRGHGPRNRFALRFFAAGTVIPVVLLLVEYLTPLGDWIPQGAVAIIWSVLVMMVWPTCILMMDAEHLPEIIVSLLFSAALNGLWYSAIGFEIWHIRRRRIAPPAGRK